MLVIVFTYNRPEMLANLLDELKEYEVIVIDDGSPQMKGGLMDLSGRRRTPNHTIIRTHHEGKKGFWKKWVMARQIALGSMHDNYLFIQDDLSRVNLKAVDEIVNQHWDESLFTVNVLDCGDKNRWGSFNMMQQDLELEHCTLREVGYVDCNFITNRHTLEHAEIRPTPFTWFDRPDKSSGVGYNMTMELGAIGAVMLSGTPSLTYHGDHESQMHGEHRKKTPLISKHQKV